MDNCYCYSFPSRGWTEVSFNLFFFLFLVRYWEVLVFFDPHNYGGVAEGREGEGQGEGDVVANWNICDSLPKIFQDMFLATISEYCLKMYQSNLSARRVAGRVRVEGEGEAEGGENEGGELYEKLFFSISQRLLSVVEGFLSGAPNLGELTAEQRIMTFYRKHQQQQQQQHQHVVNWALEFSKMICKVLALDPLFEPQVQILKSQLLR